MVHPHPGTETNLHLSAHLSHSWVTWPLTLDERALCCNSPIDNLYFVYGWQNLLMECNILHDFKLRRVCGPIR